SHYRQELPLAQLLDLRPEGHRRARQERSRFEGIRRRTFQRYYKVAQHHQSGALDASGAGQSRNMAFGDGLRAGFGSRPSGSRDGRRVPIGAESRARGSTTPAAHLGLDGSGSDTAHGGVRLVCTKRASHGSKHARAGGLASSSKQMGLSKLAEAWEITFMPRRGVTVRQRPFPSSATAARPDLDALVRSQRTRVERNLSPLVRRYYPSMLLASNRLEYRKMVELSNKMSFVGLACSLIAGYPFDRRRLWISSLFGACCVLGDSF